MGDNSFLAFVAASRKGVIGALPFDLALRALLLRRRQYARKFEHSRFVLNLGSELPLDLRAQRMRGPDAFLLHCNSFSLLSAPSLLVALGIGGERRTDVGGVMLDLRPLRRAAAVGGGVALAAFISGARYDRLCANFFSHGDRRAEDPTRL